MTQIEFKTKQLYFRGNPYRIAYIDPTPYHASWFSFDDESSVRDAIWRIDPGDVVFDVGAAYGSYGLTALSCGAKHVYAWSPEEGSPPERLFLEESLRLNDDWADRCNIMLSGAYDRSGWIDTVSQEFLEQAPAEARPSIIRVDSLDDWRSDFGVVEANRYWMKLDVEGAEVHVLQGAKKLIADLRPCITVENHNFKRATIEQEVRELLLFMGYVEVSTTPYHSVSHSLYIPK